MTFLREENPAPQPNGETGQMTALKMEHIVETANENKTAIVFLIESNAMARAGLRNYFAKDKSWRVAGEASDPLAALVGLKQQAADLVVMEAGNGVASPDAVRRIRDLVPSAKILLLSTQTSFNEIALLLEAGANGAVLKSATEEEFMSATKAVVQGGIYLSSSVGRQFFVEEDEKTPVNSFGITAREFQILEMVADGMSNKEVANQIGLSVRTVETHRLNIRRKTSCHRLSDLVRLSKRLKNASNNGEPK